MVKDDSAKRGKKLIKRIRRLIVMECPNYQYWNGMCAARETYDGANPCAQMGECSIRCEYFLESVLGIDKRLEDELLHMKPEEPKSADAGKVRCACCGKLFEPRSNRSKYCSEECRKKVKRMQNAAVKKNARKRAAETDRVYVTR